MKIIAKDREGEVHELEGREDWTLMEILRDAELGMAGECGGACACATCHVYVENDWFKKLPEASEDEVNMLDMALGVQANSRLACQITCSDEIDGIEVTMAPE